MQKLITIILIILIVFTLHCSENSENPSENGDEQEPVSCECEPLPPPSGEAVSVNSVSELESAVNQANEDDGNVTILLGNGAYTLNQMLYITADNVTIRSESGNRDEVVVRGTGMDGNVPHVFLVAGKNFTAADMTIGWVANHGIQIQGEHDSDNPLIHNVHFVDTNEQMLKISRGTDSNISCDHGIVECCKFEYTAGVGPQYYIGGVDGHRCKNWIVRNNTFMHIRSPDVSLAEHAIHFWSDSENTLVENNLIIDCDRGIGFGLGNSEHSGGIIRNNMVYTSRDVGIGLENAENVRVYHNTVYTDNYFNSIEYRFSGSTGIEIVNNLTNKYIAERDGASATLESNFTDATFLHFVDVANGDLHLDENVPEIIDQGKPLEDVEYDFDCESRPMGEGYDIGADEFSGE